MPSQVCATLPVLDDLVGDVLAVEIGIAKPIPMLPSLFLGQNLAVDADHLALAVDQRAAELPWLIAASVWIAP